VTLPGGKKQKNLRVLARGLCGGVVGPSDKKESRGHKNSQGGGWSGVKLIKNQERTKGRVKKMDKFQTLKRNKKARTWVMGGGQSKNYKSSVKKTPRKNQIVTEGQEGDNPG